MFYNLYIVRGSLEMGYGTKCTINARFNFQFNENYFSFFRVKQVNDNSTYTACFFINIRHNHSLRIIYHERVSKIKRKKLFYKSNFTKRQLGHDHLMLILIDDGLRRESSGVQT